MDAPNEITIIVPVYNSVRFVSDCIESIQQQTIRDWRLILVDDGSPDNAGQVCEEYAKMDKRITVLHQSNGGPGKARNNGIDNCTTRWFTFVDSDDNLEPDYLENFHLESLTEDTQFSIQGFKRVDTNGNFLGEKFDFTGSVYRGEGFLEKAFVEDRVFEFGQSVGKLYNTNLVNQHNLREDENMRLSEDHLFNINYLMHVTEIQTHSGTKYLYQMCNVDGSLTHRIPQWQPTMYRFERLYAACEELQKRVVFSSKRFIDYMNYFYVTGAISLLLTSLYKNEVPRAERLKALSKLRVYFKHCHNRFCPNSRNGKILKFVLRYAPTGMQDVLLSKIY